MAPRPDLQTEDPDDDDIPLAILRNRLQLDLSLTFNDYLNVDCDLGTGQTETDGTSLFLRRCEMT